MPDLWLDVDAALSEVPVNIMPLLDDSDFKTREEAVAYDAAGLELIWHFTTTAGATSATVVTPTSGGDYDWAHQDGAMYTIEIPAAGGASINNDTEGFGWFTGVATGVLPWRGPVIGFRAAALNNAMIDGGDLLDVNVTHVADTAQTGNDNGADINAILTDTNELQTDDVPGLIAALNDPTAAAIRTEIDNNSTQLAAIVADTNELQTDDVPGLIGALNNLSAADVNAEVDTALTDYDPPTNAEMVAAFAEIKGGTWNAATDTLEHIRDKETDIETDTAEIGAAGVGLTEAGGDGDHLTEAGGDGDHLVEAGGTGDQLTAVPWNAAWDAEVQSEVDDALVAQKLDHLVAVADADDVADDSIMAKLAASDGDWSGFDPATDALEAIRDRGDAAWITGGGAGITDILNVQPLVPNSIDLADTVTYRIGLLLFNALDDLPTVAEIDPGTIDIHRKALNAAAWSVVVNGAAMSELAGMIYYDEVFDSGTGYAEGDSIRITLKGQKITVGANDYEITDASGRMFYTYIREGMRGTDSAALEANVQGHAQDALIAYSLDHLVTVGNAGLKPTSGTFFDRLLNKSGGQTFDPTTDSLEAIRDTAPMGSAMRGTDNAALAATALSTAVWSIARAGYLDELGAANVPADVDTLLSRLSAVRAGYLDELAAANLPTDVANALAAIAALNDPTAAAIVLAWANALCTAYEGTAAKGSFAWIMARISAVFRQTLTDDGDGSATGQLYRSDGVTPWGTAFGMTTAPAPDGVTGTEDTI